MPKQVEEIEERLSDLLERHRVYEFTELMHSIPKLLWRNLLAGLARGVGIGIGFTLLAAVVVYFLRRLVQLNLPLIGNFIAELVEIVQTQMRLGP